MKYLISILLIATSLIGKAEKYSFEKGIPTQFQVSENSQIELSPLYYKDGTKSLQWNYQSHSFLTLDAPLTLTPKTEKNYGITLWIYNEKIQNDSLVFEFLNEKQQVQYKFSFHLTAIGWRACWIGFEQMKGKKEDKNLTTCRITAPAQKGRIFLDRLTFPVKKMNARTTPDMQMPENNSLANRDLWHWCRLWEWEQYERPTTNNISLTSSDKKDLQKIAQRLTEYCQENLSKKFIKKASSLYEECHIEKSGNGYTGKPLVAPDEKTSQDITWQYIENMLSGFAADYLKNGNDQAKELYFNTFRYAINQGFAYGSGMGTNHHYGYQTRQIYISAWLMRNEIYQHKSFR